jgi:hypothetical protein
MRRKYYKNYTDWLLYVIGKKIQQPVQDDTDLRSI